MAALPFHYYLALREDWIKQHTKVEEDDAAGAVDLDFDAEVLMGDPA